MKIDKVILVFCIISIISTVVSVCGIIYYAKEHNQVQWFLVWSFCFFFFSAIRSIISMNRPNNYKHPSDHHSDVCDRFTGKHIYDKKSE